MDVMTKVIFLWFVEINTRKISLKLFFCLIKTYRCEKWEFSFNLGFVSSFPVNILIDKLIKNDEQNNSIHFNFYTFSIYLKVLMIPMIYIAYSSNLYNCWILRKVSKEYQFSNLLFWPSNSQTWKQNASI